MPNLKELVSLLQQPTEEEKRDAYLKRFSEGVGMTGRIETRPTADIEARLDTLKEIIPQYTTGYADETNEIMRPYRGEQDGLQNESILRKRKHRELENKLYNQMGVTGPVKSRPTADMAHRLDELKEVIPEYVKRFGGDGDAGMDEFRKEQKEIKDELNFRKIKNFLKKNKSSK